MSRYELANRVPRQYNASSVQDIVRILEGSSSRIVFNNPSVAALSGGTASAETAVSLATIIPPNALYFGMYGAINPQANVSGNIDFTTFLRVVTGVNYFTERYSLTDLGATGVIFPLGLQILPNIGQRFLYHTTMTNGTISTGVSWTVQWYAIPN